MTVIRKKTFHKVLDPFRIQTVALRTKCSAKHYISNKTNPKDGQENKQATS